MTHATRTTSCNTAGFTLLELLIVLAIAALLLSLVGPRFTQFHSGAQFQQMSQTLSTALRQARNQADREGRIIRLTLDSDARQLQFADGSSLFDWPEDYTLTLLDQQGEPLIAADSILFFPAGGSSGARLRLSQQQLEPPITQSATQPVTQKRQQEILVHWLTGGVQYAAH